MRHWANLRSICHWFFRTKLHSLFWKHQECCQHQTMKAPFFWKMMKQSQEITNVVCCRGCNQDVSIVSIPFHSVSCCVWPHEKDRKKLSLPCCVFWLSEEWAEGTTDSHFLAARPTVMSNCLIKCHSLKNPDSWALPWHPLSFGAATSHDDEKKQLSFFFLTSWKPFVTLFSSPASVMFLFPLTSTPQVSKPFEWWQRKKPKQIRRIASRTQKEFEWVW